MTSPDTTNNDSGSERGVRMSDSMLTQDVQVDRRSAMLSGSTVALSSGPE